jgi:hypothetical protein
MLAIYLGFKYMGLDFVGYFTTLRIAGLHNDDLVNVLEESGPNPTEVPSRHLLEGLNKSMDNLSQESRYPPEHENKAILLRILVTV